MKKFAIIAPALLCLFAIFIAIVYSWQRMRDISSLRKLQQSQYPPGLVGRWAANYSGTDSVGSDNAVLRDITIVEGKGVNRAFAFNGDSSSIKIPANPATDLGAGDGFTIMAWINPSQVDGVRPLFQWFENGTWDDSSLSLWIGLRPDENGVLRGSIPGENNENPFVVSDQGVLVAGAFQHIAFTYDKGSSNSMLYVNGVMVARHHFEHPIVANTRGDLWISWRDDRSNNWSTGRMFSGLMDGIALYNRALSISEIQAIYTKENQGEPLALPAQSTGWQELMGFPKQDDVSSQVVTNQLNIKAEK